MKMSWSMIMYKTAFEISSFYKIIYTIFSKDYIVASYFMTDAYGPSMRNPALDRLPVSRVTRGGKGKLPVKQES